MTRLHTAGLGLLAAAICLLVSGCSKTITATSYAPNITPANNRQAMIEWHRQHDKNPAKPPSGH